MSQMRSQNTPKPPYETKDEMHKIHRDDRPRDDLKGAFGGKENVPSKSSTKMKSRQLPRKSDRTPKM